MLDVCVKASNLLRKSSVKVRVLSMHTIKPIDSVAIKKATEETGGIITVEEHNIIGGLGSAVAEVVAQLNGRHVPFSMVGIQDNFCKTIGNQEYLRSINGLTAENIVHTAMGMAKNRAYMESCLVI